LLSLTNCQLIGIPYHILGLLHTFTYYDLPISSTVDKNYPDCILPALFKPAYLIYIIFVLYIQFIHYPPHLKSPISSYS